MHAGEGTIVTIALATVDADGAVALMADSKLSGAAGTDFGAKVFELPVVISKSNGRKAFKPVYERSIGLVFAGSFLSAINTIALASGCLQNLLWKSKFPTIEEIVALIGSINHRVTKDIISKSVGTLGNPTLLFSTFVIVGLCPRNRVTKLFRIYPTFDGNIFDVQSVEINVTASQFYPISSGSNDFIALNTWMEARGISRGAYGALELMIALGNRPDIGGAIQYGALQKQGFKLVPVMTVDPVDPNVPAAISFLGQDFLDLPQFETCAIGYSVIGPTPLTPWIGAAVEMWRRDH